MTQLSIVIAAASGQSPAQRCIDALGAAGARGRADVIVVTPIPLAMPDWVRLEVLTGESRFAALRARGLEIAATTRVAILSEDYTVDAAWLERALAHSEADVVAGVTLPPANATLAARAAWLWEYAHLAPPLAAGALDQTGATLIPGGNVVYRRDRVSGDELRQAGNELAFHRGLYRRGLSFERDLALTAIYHPPTLG
ncbi:MAG: hypothetical protein KDC27_02195, partial [Acidobacteria bacterium]|nr:hypothetical protein [Acidobacteriota bacterium]